MEILLHKTEYKEFWRETQWKCAEARELIFCSENFEEMFSIPKEVDEVMLRISHRHFTGSVLGWWCGGEFKTMESDWNVVYWNVCNAMDKLFGSDCTFYIGVDWEV